MPTFVQHRLAALIRAFAPAITGVRFVQAFPHFIVTFSPASPASLGIHR